MSPPPLLRRISPYVDIDFALRHQFNKTSFRYAVPSCVHFCVQACVCVRRARFLRIVSFRIFCTLVTNTYTLHASPPQREIIVAALEGYDVVVQAATGFGKSLCFQLPAVINSGGKHPSQCVVIL